MCFTWCPEKAACATLPTLKLPKEGASAPVPRLSDSEPAVRAPDPAAATEPEPAAEEPPTAAVVEPEPPLNSGHSSRPAGGEEAQLATVAVIEAPPPGRPAAPPAGAVAWTRTCVGAEAAAAAAATAAALKCVAAGALAMAPGCTTGRGAP